jgi:transcriptional regulator with XRE-family HTH domain
MMDVDVGTRLRDLRKMHGLSQRELAKRAGVTNGMISLIEQNRASPSVSSLKKVLDGFPISMAYFFTTEFGSDNQVFYTAEELPNMGSGELAFHLVGFNHPDRSMSILHEVYPAGVGTGDEMLQHQGEEGGVVVRGQIEVTVAGETRTLKAGDAYYFDSRMPHRFNNNGDEECEIISANSPPTI